MDVVRDSKQRLVVELGGTVPLEAEAVRKYLEYFQIVLDFTDSIMVLSDRPDSNVRSVLIAAMTMCSARLRSMTHELSCCHQFRDVTGTFMEEGGNSSAHSL